MFGLGDWLQPDGRLDTSGTSVYNQDHLNKLMLYVAAHREQLQAEAAAQRRSEVRARARSGRDWPRSGGKGGGSALTPGTHTCQTWSSDDGDWSVADQDADGVDPDGDCDYIFDIIDPADMAFSTEDTACYDSIDPDMAFSTADTGCYDSFHCDEILELLSN